MTNSTMTSSTFQKKHRYCYVFYGVLITSLMSACGDPGMTDLTKYVAKVKARENPHVDPIPEYRHIPSYYYEVQHLRDPFIPLIDTKRRNINRSLTFDKFQQKKEECPNPQDSHRVRVGLEQMPLDALQMVGTLKVEGSLWALVVSKGEGTIYKLKQGDYVGENYGKIVNISGDKIEVMEQVPDGEGCWKEELSAIQLMGS